MSSGKLYDYHPSIRFACQCGSLKYYRPKCMRAATTFYEGYYRCCICNAKHSYTSDAFKLTPKQPQPTQLQLL